MCDIYVTFLKIRVKNAPESKPCFTKTSETSNKVPVFLEKDGKPYMDGNFTIYSLKNNPDLIVEVKNRHLSWDQI